MNVKPGIPDMVIAADKREKSPSLELMLGESTVFPATCMVSLHPLAVWPLGIEMLIDKTTASPGILSVVPPDVSIMYELWYWESRPIAGSPFTVVGCAPQ